MISKISKNIEIVTYQNSCHTFDVHINGGYFETNGITIHGVLTPRSKILVKVINNGHHERDNHFVVIPDKINENDKFVLTHKYVDGEYLHNISFANITFNCKVTSVSNGKHLFSMYISSSILNDDIIEIKRIILEEV